MLRKKLRKILRRWLKSLLDEEATPAPGPDLIQLGICRCNAENVFIHGASSAKGRNVIVRQIRTAQRNREL